MKDSKYVTVPLYIEKCERHPSIRVSKSISLFAGGGVQIGNRWFRRNEIIDVSGPDINAKREKKSSCLDVTVEFPEHEVYRFVYKWTFFNGYGWYQLVPCQKR